jgi:hypothetical protein
VCSSISELSRRDTLFRRYVGHVLVRTKVSLTMLSSADKYADKSKHTLIPFQHENTVLGNMARSELTFVLWLYATVTVRDGMSGNFNTEEVHWFYNKSLKIMQETLQRETAAGNYSDHLINAVSCITAAAVSTNNNADFRTHTDRGRYSLVCSTQL